MISLHPLVAINSIVEHSESSSRISLAWCIYKCVDSRCNSS